VPRMGTCYELSAEKIAHFQSIPWCSEILREGDYTPVGIPPNKSRVPNEESLLSETLQTDNTIRKAVVYVRNRPSETPEETLVLYDLGSGVNGFPNICHGGFVATLLDEVTGVLITVRNTSQKKTLPFMTANLNVTFRKPVATPGVVLARARVVKSLGRKLWIEGSLENQHGDVCSTVSALFVELKGVL